MVNITALVLGGTGEVGSELITKLVAHPSFIKIISAGRSEPRVSSEKLVFKEVDFEKLDDFKDAFEDVQVAYCCLGTTRGKAGKEGFVRVDRDYVVNSAKLLRESGCQQFHLVTSVGSNKDSKFLYRKVKGEVEELVSDLKFPNLFIYQPGLLLCERKETRLFEAFAQTVAKGFDWRNRFSVHTETVAQAMITNTLLHHPSKQETEQPLVHRVPHSEILTLGID